MTQSRCPRNARKAYYLDSGRCKTSAKFVDREISAQLPEKRLDQEVSSRGHSLISSTPIGYGAQKCSLPSSKVVRFLPLAFDLFPEKRLD